MKKAPIKVSWLLPILSVASKTPDTFYKMKLLLLLVFIGLAMSQTVYSRPNEPRDIEREQIAYQEPQPAEEVTDNKKVDKRSYIPWLWPSYGHGLGHGIILSYPLYGHGWSGHGGWSGGHGLHGGWSLGWPLYSLGGHGWHGSHGGWHNKW